LKKRERGKAHGGEGTAPKPLRKGKSASTGKASIGAQEGHKSGKGDATPYPPRIPNQENDEKKGCSPFSVVRRRLVSMCVKKSDQKKTEGNGDLE